MKPYAQWFIDYGRPADLIALLDEAHAELTRAQARRDRAISLHVGATAALVQHLKRARLLVEVLDCQVRSAFEGDAVKLAEWGVARRVQGKPGPRREVVGAEVVVGDDRVERVPLTLSVAA